MREAEQARRASEQEAQAQQIKIQQAESSLYGGSVHNPKELQDLQADVASLKKHLSSIEEQELDAMQKVETDTARSEAAKEQLEQLQARLSGEHRKLIDQEALLSRDMADMQTERAAAVTQWQHSRYSKPTRVCAWQRGGLAVAEVSKTPVALAGTTLTAACSRIDAPLAQLSPLPILWTHLIRSLTWGAMQFPFAFSVDPFSFLFGFVIATIFWWVVARARPLWEEIGEISKATAN